MKCMPCEINVTCFTKYIHIFIHHFGAAKKNDVRLSSYCQMLLLINCDNNGQCLLTSIEVVYTEIH